VDGGVVEHWFDRWCGSLDSLAKEKGTLAAHWGGWLGGEWYHFGIGITMDTIGVVYTSSSLRTSLGADPKESGRQSSKNQDKPKGVRLGLPRFLGQLFG
jgi:hypothetical protein